MISAHRQAGRSAPRTSECDEAFPIDSGTRVDVLIVDDEEAARNLMSRRLARAGFSTDSASDASEALELLDSRAPSVILLDLRMPGLDGVGFLARLRGQRSPGALPVIVVTASGERADLWRCLDAGANDYVTKPIDFPALTRRVGVQLQVAESFRKLEESERRLARASAHGPEIGWSLDLDTGRLEATESFLRMFQCHSGEGGLGTWLASVYHTDRAPLASAIADLETRRSVSFECRLRAPGREGELHWALVRGRAVGNGESRSVLVQGDVLDLSVDRGIDRVTGAGSSTACHSSLAELLSRGESRPIAVLDIDDFNGHLGSQAVLAADDFLKGFAARLGHAVADAAEVFRLSSDQFALIGSPWIDEGAFHNVVVQVAAGTGISVRLYDRDERRVTSSIGVVTATRCADAPERTLARARIAMKAAKAAGQGRVETWSEDLERVAVRRPLMAERLRLAIELRAIGVEFRPIADLESGRWVAIEASPRWRDGVFGDVSTHELRACADAMGASLELAELVIDQAFAVAPAQKDDRTEPPLVAIGLAGTAARDPALSTTVLRIADAFRIDLRRLVVELKEEDWESDQRASTGGFAQLTDRGARLAIDDFGSIGSSLTLLFRTDPMWLKLSGSLLHAAENDVEARALLASLARCARHLGKIVVACDVATANQAAVAKDIGATLAQGDYYSAPLSASELGPAWKERS
jgi:EAL domain-containing protein (putative c-di-GMP-specific phosphodiesterase class I)/PleD family two-component response regulator